MANRIQNIAIALVVSMVLCSASPARLEKLRPSKSKALARQEVAEDIPAQTPYPPAGTRPDIPFDLPTDAKLEAPDNTYLPPVGEPAQTYGPPAKTYGPPEVSIKTEVEEVANDEHVQEAEQPNDVQSEEFQPEQPQAEEEPEIQPEEVEPPQQSEEEQQVDEVAEDDAEVETHQIELVTEDEGLNTIHPERLVLAKQNLKKAAKLQVASQPIYFVGNNGQLYRLLK